MVVPATLSVRIRRIAVVALMVALIVAGAFVSATGGLRGSEAAASTFAVYLQPASVPESERLNLSADDVGDVLDGREFRIVETTPELETLVAVAQPQSIWVHADAIGGVPTSLLRDAMRQGTVIVGIDMTSRTLASKLKVSAGATPDWHPEGVVTFVLYAEALNVPYTNELGQPATRGFRTSANERVDPRNPAGLLWIVDQTIERIRETYG